MQHEVHQINDYQFDEKTGEVRWLVEFVSERKWAKRDSEWVPDNECQCPSKISKFLATHPHNLTTFHLICRISCRNQAGPAGISLQQQESALKEAAQGMVVPRRQIRTVIHRLSTSAYQKVPLEIHDTCTYARPGDVILFYRVDRLSRNIVEFLHIIEEAHKRGVFFYSHDEQLWYHDENPELPFVQKLLNAQRESEILSRKAKQSWAFRRARGDHMGISPFGYSKERDENGRVYLVKNPSEQRILALIDLGYNVATLNSSKTTLYRKNKPWTRALYERAIREHQRQEQ